MKHEVIAIGTSTGGLDALKKILSVFNAYDEVVLIIVQHLSPSCKSYLSQILSAVAKRQVVEVEDKMKLERGGVYLAPPNYHVLIEKNGYFTLDTSEKVCYSRPSIDVTFESVADAFGERAIGVLLTGANRDGGIGLKAIKQAGGYTMVQDPETAEAREMPEYALRVTTPDEMVTLHDIGMRLNDLIKALEN